MTVIYIVCKFLTFPGAYMKGFLEHIITRLCKCGTESKGYLRLDEISGHTDHCVPSKKSKAVVIAILPGLIQFIFGMIFTVSGLLPLVILGTGTQTPVLFAAYIAISYVGISMLCNLCPLVDDALLCKELVYGKNKSNLFVRIILFLPVYISLIGAYLEKYCINIIIAVACVTGVFIIM